MARLRPAAALLLALPLIDCGGAIPTLSGEPERQNTGMAGRWMLSAPNAPACGLTFTESAENRSGRVVPDGGCPARFYLGRRWALEGGLLTIRDDNGDPVGQMTLAGERFDGTSATGIPITLSRPIPPPTE